jgi:hypothetical protein
MEREPFSPDHVVDRAEEKDTFLQLLDDVSTPGLLALRTPEGTGKSTVMKYLHHLTKERGAAAIFIEIEAGQTRFWLVEKMAAQLEDSSVHLPNFERLNKARVFGDVEPFGLQGPTLPSTSTGVDLFASSVEPGATVIGAQYTNIMNGGLPPSAEEYARKACTKAFLDDLENACDETKIAILLDAYNHESGDIHEWLLGPLLKQRISRAQDKYGGLVIVLAGETVPIPDIRAALGDQFGRMARCRERLSAWTEDDVRRWLTQLGIRYDELDVAWILARAHADGNLLHLKGALKLVEQGPSG